MNNNKQTKNTQMKQLPNGWKWVKIDMIIDKNIEIFNQTSYDHESFEYIDISCIDNVQKKVVLCKTIKTSEAPSRAQYVLKNNDIIISTVRPNLNAVALITNIHHKCIGSSGFCVIRLHESYNPKFVFRFFTAPKFIQYVSDLVLGAMYPAIHNNDVYDYEIPIPLNIDEQIAISKEIENKLDEVDMMRQAALKQKEAATAMQSAILREAFPYKPGDKLPAGWQWKHIDEICTLNPSRSKSLLKDPDALISFVPMEAVDEKKGIISKQFFKPQSEVCNGYTYFENDDVIFAKITPCMQNGKSAIVKNLLNDFGFGSTEFHVIRPDKVHVINRWIYYIIRSKEFRYYAEMNFSGSAGQKRVPVDFIKDYLIPLPSSTDKQEMIADEIEHKLDEIEKVIEMIDKQIEGIVALPNAILREAFNFENQVKDE